MRPTLLLPHAGQLLCRPHRACPSAQVELTDVFAGKKGVLFGVPGAFTPGCSKTHLPGYINDYEKLKDAGAEIVVCTAGERQCSS